MNTNMTEYAGLQKNLCILVLWIKIASALEGLNVEDDIHAILPSMEGMYFSIVIMEGVVRHGLPHT